ncbi:MAG: hypothetical protein RL328_938 [Acidobacteriota bacterium]|jgi:hypothetical protein
MRLILLAVTAVIAAAQTAPPYAAPTQGQRLKWATLATAGAPNLAAGVFTSAISTAFNNPREYGPHWDGYGKRQALRLTGASTSNFMEAELGALWGEDPRYRRSTAGTVKGRVWHAVKTAFLSYDRQGHLMPAYARYVSVPASNVLANAWRPDSQHTAGQTSMRVTLGFLSRVSSNTFAEFWPDIRRRLRH